jgi:hypothetical protein
MPVLKKSTDVRSYISYAHFLGTWDPTMRLARVRYNSK